MDTSYTGADRRMDNNNDSREDDLIRISEEDRNSLGEFITIITDS